MSISKKPSILFVITKSNFGGAQKYVFELARKSKEDGFGVTVVSGGNGTLSDKLKAEGIKTISVPSLTRDVSPVLDIKSFFEIFKIFKSEKPDIVHLNSSKIGGIGSLAARLAGIPKIIFTVHGWAFNENRLYVQKVAIKIASAITILLCTNVIAISKRIFAETISFPFATRKTTLIYNGVVESEIYDRQNARALLNLPQTDFIVGTVAELTQNKGIAYAIDAFSDISFAKYAIIGSGELEKKLRKQSERNMTSEKIFFCGQIDNASKLLKAFDIFLLSSLKEGLPYTLLEAGLAEIPVVSTNVGSISEIIDADTGILIPPKDTLAIKKAIMEIRENPETTQTRVRKLKEHITNNFSMQAMFDKTFDLYLSTPKHR